VDPETPLRPATCTLDAPAFRLREHEFRQLFARRLTTVETVDARSARLVLTTAAESELRDLLAREQRCCGFFDFDVAVGGDVVALTVRVPEGSEDALAFLLGLTAA
jgi:hypothetical protein